MKKNNRIINYSLLAALCAVVTADSLAAIRVGSQTGSYASSSKNTLAMQQQYQNYLAQTQAAQNAASTNSADAENGLPVRVADADLAARIQNGDAGTDVTVNTLDKCAMLYPEGEFVWDRPTIGHLAGGPATCVAIVEMRMLGQLPSAGQNAYLTTARGKLAAGDAIKCNISEFPQSTYLPDIMRVEFPADAKPTREDVIQALNAEQKNKAGLKIGGAILTGMVAGNALGKNETGSDKLFGFNSEKMKSTLIGGLAAGGIMTASTYSGKVAGDVILSTGINATAGAITGNMYDAVTGSGDTLLRVEKCGLEENGSIVSESTCLWGTLKEKGETIQETNNSDSTKTDYGYVFYNVKEKTVFLCKEKDNDKTYKECASRSDFQLGTIKGADVSVTALDGKDVNVVLDKATKYKYDTGEKQISKDESGEWVQIEGTTKIKASHAVVIYDFPESKRGTSISDYDKWKTANLQNAKICLRSSKGNAYSCDSDILKDKNAFSPISKSSSDGKLVDLSDKTRTKDTVKGAAVGAGLGGFSAYQGAQEDIEARYVQAVEEYNASLRNFVCGTGKKWLGDYNDDIEIPELGE